MNGEITDKKKGNINLREKNMTTQDLVKSIIYQRIYLLRTDESCFTGFTLEYKNVQYLCTAKHCVVSEYYNDTLLDSRYIYIYYKGVWVETEIEMAGFGSGGADICVFATKTRLPSPSCCPRPSLANIIYSQDVYFLGFPYGMRFDTTPEVNNGYPLPFVKKAVMSAGAPPNSKPNLVFLDGHGNRGFSGGPVVFRNVGCPQESFQIGAVVSGKKTEQDEPNTGILIAHDIKHAIDAIEAKHKQGGDFA